MVTDRSGIGVQNHLDRDAAPLVHRVGTPLETRLQGVRGVVRHGDRNVVRRGDRSVSRNRVGDGGRLVPGVVVLGRRCRYGLGGIPVARGEDQAGRLGGHVGVVRRIVDRHGHGLRRLGVQHHGVGGAPALVDAHAGGIDRHPGDVVVGDGDGHGGGLGVVASVPRGCLEGNGQALVVAVGVVLARDGYGLRIVPRGGAETQGRLRHRGRSGIPRGHRHRH